MGLSFGGESSRIKAAMLGAVAHLAPVAEASESIAPINVPALSSCAFNSSPTVTIQDPTPALQEPRVSSLPAYDAQMYSRHVMQMKIAKYREQEPNMAAYKRLLERSHGQSDSIRDLDRPASSFAPSSKPIGSPLEERIKTERNSGLNDPDFLIRTISRDRIADLTLRKGSHLSREEANYIAFEVESEVTEAFREGSMVAPAAGAAVGILLQDVTPTTRVLTATAVNWALSGYTGDLARDRAEMKKHLVAEASAALDPSKRELTHKLLQRMATESPLTYDSLQQRGGPSTILPPREELEKAMEARDQTLRGPASLLEKGAVKGGKLTDAEQSLIKENAGKIAENQKLTENALDKAASSSVKLKKAEEELAKKIAELEKSGGDPASLLETREYENYEAALKKDILHQKEVHACIEQSVELISRIDPKAGQLFSRSYNLLKGVEKTFGGTNAKTFGDALSNLKFSDLLSLTNLTFALFDGLFGGGPDATQQALANIEDTLDHMDKKLDTIIKSLSDIQRENRENFAHTNGKIEALGFQAEIFHRREMELLVSGLRDLTFLQLEGLKKLDSIDDKLDQLTHNQVILTGLVLRVRDELKNVSELIKVGDLSRSIQNLKNARRNGHTSSGNPETLIADFEKVRDNVFAVAKELAETNGLQRSRPTDGKVNAAELEIFDLLQFPIGDHPGAIAEYLKLTDPTIVDELRCYRFLDEVVTLLIDISESEKLTGLSPDERPKLTLTPREFDSYSTYLENSQKAFHELGMALEEHVFPEVQRVIKALRANIDQALSAKEPLGGATPQRNFDPQQPTESLQSVADAEPVVSLNSKFSDLISDPQLIRPAATNFQITVLNPRWKQAVLHNSAGAIAYYSEQHQLAASRNALSSAGAMVQHYQNLSKTPIIYGNMHTEEYSKEPKEGFIPLYASGHWDDCSPSGAFKKDGTPLAWNAAPEVVVDVRTNETSFNGGVLCLQPSLRIHRVLNNPVMLRFDRPVMETKGVESRGAEFDEERGVRTDRTFTNEAPGLPGEHIHLEVTQYHRVFLTPTFRGVLQVGEVPVADIECSFPEQHPETFVDVKSEQEFTYTLGCNTVGRYPQHLSSRARTILPDGFPYTDHGSSISLHTILFPEPKPLNQLHLQSQKTGPGKVVAVRHYGQTSAETMQTDVSEFQVVQARLMEAIGTSLDKLWSGKDGLWRDRVLGVTASDKEVNQGDPTAIGVFKQGEQWHARVLVSHSIDKDIYVTTVLPPAFTPSGLGAKFQLKMRGDLSELRDGNVPANSPLRPLAEMKSNWITTKAQERATSVVKEMKKGGSALQQRATELEAKILLLHNFIEDFGYLIREADYEISALESGSVRTTLDQQWRDPNHSLLQLAGYVAGLESGKAKGKELFELVDGAERSLQEIRGRIDRARRSNPDVRYASPQLDRLQTMMAHRKKAPRGR